MTSFVNVCDVKSAEKLYACLKIVNNKTKINNNNNNNNNNNSLYFQRVTHLAKKKS